MDNGIKPELKSIRNYLTLNLKDNEYFVIPEYQRSYSWTDAQCDKLWQDIESFIDSNATDSYFFGTIIVDCSKKNELSLIDGQQRTTTFLLLLKALLLRLDESILEISKDKESEALKTGLEIKRNQIMKILYKAEDEEIFDMLKDHSKIMNRQILENRSINEEFRDAVKTIIEAKDYSMAEQNVYKIPRKQKNNKYTPHFRNFKYFFDKLGNKNVFQLNTFAKIFLEECQVIEIRSWHVEQAISMFNSLNATGMPLSDADIISASLYSKADDCRSDFTTQWKEIIELANELSTRKLVDIDDILQQFMYINRAINKEYINQKKDGTDSVDVTTPGLLRYYTEIKKDIQNKPLELCQKLNKIANIWDTIKDFPLVKLLLKFNENAKLFLIGYLYRFEPEKINEKKVFDICECLIRLFTILELDESGYSSSKFKTFLFGENIKLVDMKVSIDEIKNDFNEHIRKHWGKSKKEQNAIRDAIIDYEKNLLVFLNEYIYSKNHKQGGRKGFNFAENVNIEHIMPASGRNIQSIQNDAGILNSDEFLDLVNKLGNKILLEAKINKSISNEWFKSKKQHSINDKAGYKDSDFAIAKALTTYPKNIWTKKDIESTTKKVADRITKFIFDN